MKTLQVETQFKQILKLFIKKRLQPSSQCVMEEEEEEEEKVGEEE